MIVATIMQATIMVGASIRGGAALVVGVGGAAVVRAIQAEGRVSSMMVVGAIMIVGALVAELTSPKELKNFQFYKG